jgi:hypothetical protein
MADWKTHEFMSQWDKKYVSTNLRPGSKPYEREFFLTLASDLATQHPELQNISPALIVRSSLSLGGLKYYHFPTRPRLTGQLLCTHKDRSMLRGGTSRYRRAVFRPPHGAIHAESLADCVSPSPRGDYDYFPIPGTAHVHPCVLWDGRGRREKGLDICVFQGASETHNRRRRRPQGP